MKRVTFIVLSVLLASCSSKISSNIISQNKSLTIEDKVAFLDIQHLVPENVKKIGDARYQDTGFSTNCDLYTNLVSARKLARQNGANIVKVIEKKTPDLWSSCYRIKVEFYYYEGDVTKLKQYQLQIN